ncbi:hypothetical protein [[Eubacterium] cellulosolvens]
MKYVNKIPNNVASGAAHFIFFNGFANNVMPAKASNIIAKLSRIGSNALKMASAKKYTPKGKPMKVIILPSILDM